MRLRRPRRKLAKESKAQWRNRLSIPKIPVKQFCAASSISMQRNGWAPAAQLHHLHFTPGDTVDTGAERLADGFLSGEASGKTRSLATALAYLHFSEDAFEETLTMMLINLAHPVYFDDIDADSHIHSLWYA